MLKRLNRDYKQSLDDIEKEFSNCHVLVLLDSIEDDEGHLIAISTSSDTSNDLYQILSEYSPNTPIYRGGTYSDGISVNI